MKHTPGKWRLKRHKSGLLSIMGGNTNPDMENGKSVIAEVYPAHVPLSALHPDEIEANGRLIAQAWTLPKLADALGLMLDGLEPSPEAIQAARAALALLED